MNPYMATLGLPELRLLIKFSVMSVKSLVYRDGIYVVVLLGSTYSLFRVFTPSDISSSS